MTCDFCNPQVITSQKVYEDDLIIAIYPQKPTIFHHLILFPKKHYQLISEISPEESVRMNQVIEKIHLSFKVKNNCIGYNLTSNNGGLKIGQTVPHCHSHLFLRFDDEVISPFKVMNDPSLKIVLTTDEWESRKKIISTVINKK